MTYMIEMSQIMTVFATLSRKYNLILNENYKAGKNSTK